MGLVDQARDTDNTTLKKCEKSPLQGPLLRDTDNSSHNVIHQRNVSNEESIMLNNNQTQSALFIRFFKIYIGLKHPFKHEYSDI